MVQVSIGRVGIMGSELSHSIRADIKKSNWRKVRERERTKEREREREREKRKKTEKRKIIYFGLKYFLKLK